MTEPLIHFLVPYVGRRDYLEECVNSALRQTDGRWLLTVVEDGDQGLDVVEWLRTRRDPRVEHRLNEERLGLPRNFQQCLELARAPYVVVMGCDDRLLPTYVEHLAAVLDQEDGPALVQPGVRVIDGRGTPGGTLADRTKRLLRPRNPRARLGGERAARSLMRGNWLYFPSLCWRASVVQSLGFRQDLPTTLDLELVCRLLLRGETLVSTPDEVVFEYRRHGDSASSLAAHTLSRFLEERQLFAELADVYGCHGWARASRAARLHLTSRLHALTFLVSTVKSRDAAGTCAVLRHAGALDLKADAAG